MAEIGFHILGPREDERGLPERERARLEPAVATDPVTIPQEQVHATGNASEMPHVAVVAPTVEPAAGAEMMASGPTHPGS